LRNKKMTNFGPSISRRSAIFARLYDLRGDAGSALAELGVFFSMLVVPLLLGTTDLATVVYDSIEISNAAHAGAVAGAPTSAQAAATSTIKTAAQAEAADFSSSSVTVTPTTYYVCNTAQGGTQYSTQSAANTACTSPAYALEFVQVTVSAPLTLPFHCCGLPASITLYSSSVMEVEGQQ
jgi:Flp pilus assembly protein TadG